MERFKTQYRVIYSDTDPFDVVYYARYLDFFERGRTELFRQMGFTYRQWQEKGVFTPVTETFCKYHRSARYDDLIEIETTIAFLKKASIRFDYQIFKKEDQRLLSDGYTVHAFVNREGKIQRIPEEIRQKMVLFVKQPG